jgi:hypothetical protein
MGRDITEREIQTAIGERGGWLPRYAVKVTGLRPEDWRDERGRPDYDAPTTAWLTPAASNPMQWDRAPIYSRKPRLMSAEMAGELAKRWNMTGFGTTAEVLQLKVGLHGT